jgi:hypothetical protein
MSSASAHTNGPWVTRPRVISAAILVLLFLASVAVRAPHLGQPLRQLHEAWLPATVLTTLQIWEQEGALAHRFCPIMTYPGPANRNIDNQAGYSDGNGRRYYVSYPPFAYMLPYVVFRLVGVHAGVFPLQIFGLGVHLLTCLLVYLTMTSLTAGQYPSKVNRSALVAYLVYLFAPVTLWYHCNVYMCDMLVQLFLAAGIYLCVRVRQGRAGYADYVALAVNTCLLVYTEWIGVFFVASVVLYAALHRQRKDLRTAAMIVAASAALPLIVTVWQYSQVNSFSAYMDVMLHKYAQRSGLGEAGRAGYHLGNAATWKFICLHYRDGYLPFLVLIYTLAWSWFSLKTAPFNAPVAAKRTAEVLVLYLSLLPVVMHHVLLANFTMLHEFSALKTGLFLAFTGGLLYSKLDGPMGANVVPLVRLRKMDAVHALIALTLLWSVFSYSKVHRCHDVDRFKQVGETIALQASNDETVFLETNKPTIQPAIVFYAQRNIAMWNGLAEARELLAADGVDKGIVFVADPDTEQVTGMRRFAR